MLAELASTLSAAPADSNRAKYAAAIIETNCLGKRTRCLMMDVYIKGSVWSARISLADLVS